MVLFVHFILLSFPVLRFYSPPSYDLTNVNKHGNGSFSTKDLLIPLNYRHTHKQRLQTPPPLFNTIISPMNQHINFTRIRVRTCAKQNP